jgi:hypothetical protein
VSLLKLRLSALKMAPSLLEAGRELSRRLGYNE